MANNNPSAVARREAERCDDDERLAMEVDKLEATLSKADISKAGGGELFPSLGSSDPTAPLMELSTRFQRVPPGYRLPTVGVEILHAEGMAKVR
jgi:hypothetical protein